MLLISLYCLISLITAVTIETPKWAARMDGVGDDRANSVAFDSAGNLIVAGFFYSATLYLYDSLGI